MNRFMQKKAQYDAGEIKVLAHNGDAPVAGFDGVQTFRDQGVDLGLPVWRALVLPKATPDDIAQGWEEILRQTMADPALKEGLCFGFRRPCLCGRGRNRRAGLCLGGRTGRDQPRSRHCQRIARQKQCKRPGEHPGLSNFNPLAEIGPGGGCAPAEPAGCP